MQIIDMTFLNFRRTLDYEEKVKKLNEALESRKIVERAKWVLVEENKISENDAYEIIRKRSRDGRSYQKLQKDYSGKKHSINLKSCAKKYLQTNICG
jgi:response regulator NasT